MPAPAEKQLERTIYIPRMADHAFAIGAAFRACGFDAEVLPESDEETLLWGKKYSSGKECYPFIATTGDIIKKTKTADFVPEHSAFFMPTVPAASGNTASCSGSSWTGSACPRP